MSTTAKQIFAFGPFQMDLEERLLLRDEEPIDVTAKLFDLLALLVRNQGRLVETEDIKKLWPDRFVEEEDMSVRISALRRALGDDSQYIQAIPGRGYRFVAPVTELPLEEAVPETQEATGAEDYPLTGIGRLATDMGITDLSSRHSEYAHGPLEAKGRES